MLALLLAGIVLLALSGVPCVTFRGRVGELATVFATLVGAGCGLTAAVETLRTGNVSAGSASWNLPEAAAIVRLDPLAAAFLLPVFVLGAIGTVYGLAYWGPGERASSTRVRVFTGILLAGMATVVVAAHAILFLIAWELMALAAFFLIATDDADAKVRDAAWMYLIATHAGTLALLAMFVLMRDANGTFALGPVANAGPVFPSIVFLLALGGFGLKAGVVPLHFWLPAAHANAPSPVSALLSGAMLKVGIYGILRALSWLPAPRAWWGGLLVMLGLGGALTAITLAISETDMKRVLAYSSIENVGIIISAIGIATLGRALDLPALVAIGLAAAVLHVWNHSVFKGLLFLGAGSILHATGTRGIESMGGLLKRMPWTGTALIAGAAAGAALPGTSAFASEALLYFALIGTAPGGLVLSMGAAALALTGALAVVCFVRLAGTILLGEPRTACARDAHESPRLMHVPLAVLAGAALLLGVAPTVVSGPIDVVVPGAGTFATPFLSALEVPIQLAVLGTVVLAVILAAVTRWSPRSVTWDCGFSAPTARMQYTGGSLGEWMTTRLTPEFVRPGVSVSSPTGLFPAACELTVETSEPFAGRIYRPVAARWAARAMRFRWLHQGRLTHYLLYIFLTLVAGIGWAILFPRFTGNLWLRASRPHVFTKHEHTTSDRGPRGQDALAPSGQGGLR